jgi:hypothetical protein
MIQSLADRFAEDSSGGGFHQARWCSGSGERLANFQTSAPP